MKSLLLKTGMSICLGRNGELMEYSTGFQNYIDSFINILPQCYFILGPDQSAVLKKTGLTAMLTTADNRYRENAQRIARSGIAPNLQKLLATFHELVKAMEIVSIPFTQLTGGDLSTMDDCYRNIFDSANSLALIQSPFLPEVYNKLMEYDIFRKGNGNNDFWKHLHQVDKKIRSASFFRPYLLKALFNINKNAPDKLPAIADALKTNAGADPFVDTLSAIAGLLNLSKKDYAAAKAGLNGYTNGKYDFFLAEENPLPAGGRNIAPLRQVNLVDFERHKIPLNKVITGGSKKLTVLDFWASWCVPCIADYPYLKKTEDLLKDSSIQFISISIDTEEDTGKWIARTKELNIYKKRNQYRLENAKNSAVNAYFNLVRIPRYIVIDRKGAILEENFSRPTDAAFARKLQAYLRNINDGK
ncbi:MAG: thioredoxin-like domain-containing protein [Flavihumibacter sp.]